MRRAHRTRARGPWPTEIFLSHASRDRSFADAFAGTLRKHGVPVWYSSTNIQGAQQWHDEIGAALSRCDWFVVLLSRSAVRSQWVKRELLFALNDRRYENRILPVRMLSCNWKLLSWTLDALQMVDFGRDFDEGCRRTLATWGIGLDPRQCIRPVADVQAGLRQNRSAAP